MEQKAKFIVVGLLGFVLILIFLYAQTLNSKQLLTKERDQLKSDNASLSEKAERFAMELRDKKSENDSLRKELDKNKKDIMDLQQQYDEAIKARDELTEKLKTAQEAPRQMVQTLVAPQDAEAYWADVLKSKMDLEMQLESVRKELRNLQINNEQLQREKSSLAIEIEGLARDKEDLQRQIEYNKKMMDSVAKDLVRETSDKLKIQEGFAPIKNENAVLTRQLNGLNEKKIVLEKKLASLQADKGDLEKKVGEMETMLIDKTSQISGLKDELEIIRKSRASQPSAAEEKKGAVELSPIVVRPQENQASSAEEVQSVTANGSILSINKESNFVIIDSGDDTGVKTGDIFRVYRGGENIAVIKVIKASKSVSACDIEQETKPVKIGDLIVK